MSYIDRNLTNDEQVLYRTKKHPIIFFYPFLLICFTLYASYYMLSNPLLAKLVWVPWLVASIFFAYTWLEYVTSEFAVTNKRIMMREGFFTRHTNETRLTTISQVSVDQSLIGQLFNYGTVVIFAYGARDRFTFIARPILFQRYLNEQRDRLAI